MASLFFLMTLTSKETFPSIWVWPNKHKCSLLVCLISSALAQIGVFLGRLGRAVGGTNEYDQMVYSNKDMAHHLIWFAHINFITYIPDKCWICWFVHEPVWMLRFLLITWNKCNSYQSWESHFFQVISPYFMSLYLLWIWMEKHEIGDNGKRGREHAVTIYFETFTCWLIHWFVTNI